MSKTHIMCIILYKNTLPAFQICVGGREEKGHKRHMKLNKDNKYLKWGLTAFLVIAASIFFYYLIFHSSNISAGIQTAWKVMMPIVFGLILAYLLTPVLNHVEHDALIPVFNFFKVRESSKRKSAIRALGIFLTILLFIAVVGSLIFMMLSQIVPSIANIVSNFDSYYNNIIKWVNELLNDNPELEEYILNTIDRYSVRVQEILNNAVFSLSGEVIKTVSLSVINILKVTLNIIIGVLVSIYLMASKEKFAGQAKKSVYALFEQDTANSILSTCRFTHKTFIGFIGGKIVDSLIIGVLCFIGTSILKTPYAALVSLIVGATNVIPYFGPFIGAIPSILLVFVVDPLHPLNAVYLALFILVLQQFDGNILGPKILGEYTGLSSFWVIFAITIFGGLWGVVGMIIGVPFFAVVYAGIKFFIYKKLHKKHMPEKTDLYVNVGYVSGEEFHNFDPFYKRNKAAKQEKRKNRRTKANKNFDDSEKNEEQTPEDKE